MRPNYNSEKGQKVLEVSLVISAIVLVIIAGITSLREAVINTFTRYSDRIEESSISSMDNPALRISPGEGYTFRIKDKNGETHELPHSYNWDLVYRIPNDNSWYYHSVDGPVVLIDTLEIIEP